MSEAREDKASSVRSEKSYVSKGTSRSSASMAALNARAKAEAARKRAEYAKKEIEMQVKKAELKVEETRLEATLQALQQERDAEAAHAEAIVFETAVNDFGEEHVRVPQRVDTLERTFNYVKDQLIIKDSTSPIGHTEYNSMPAPNVTVLTPKQEPTRLDTLKEYVLQPLSTDKGENVSQSPKLMQKTSPGTSPRFEHKVSMQLGNISDVARFLARRDLLTGGLRRFSDKAGDYWGWKSSFENVICDLNLTASEELDLLIKWLGAESVQYAYRLRAVHINNPSEELAKVWERLNECYGSPEAIENALLNRLDRFPKISYKDPQLLRELQDLLLEIDAAKSEGYIPGLLYLDTARGINPVVEKLPYAMQEKWMNYGSKYKEDHCVSFLPFSAFVAFISREAKMRNDPSFRQSECPSHKKPHALKKWRAFREMPLEERKAYLKKNTICFKCCASTNHQAKTCKSEIHCTECDSKLHVTALHPGLAPTTTATATIAEPVTVDGGESNAAHPTAISTCTQVCGNEFESHSCAKICLVFIYPKNSPEKKLKAYAILDDQRNRSLAKSSVFDTFGITRNSFPYKLRTCAGLEEVTGRRAFNFIVESADCTSRLELQTLIECDMLPDNRSEIPTAEAAQNHTHLQEIAMEIPAFDQSAQILLLIGRDVIQAHKVLDQRNGPPNAPFAQKLALGWVIIGNVCLGGAHKPTRANIFKTNILDNGRPSHFLPCKNAIQVKESFNSQGYNKVNPPMRTKHSSIGETVFKQTSLDESLGYSQEERAFLQIMDKEVYQDTMQRLTSVRHMLNKRPQIKGQFTDFMQTLFDNGHAEIAPPLTKEEECWYLPFFGVYHLRKPEQIRIVFDSSAQHNGVSLNDVLLTGPNLNNSMLGVLMRLREENVAVTADIEQMFHCFVVREDHRNFLRFLWHQNNDIDQPIDRDKQDITTQHLVERHFYVDDCLASFQSSTDAIAVMQNAQDTLASSNLRLHKIASNDVNVMKAFHKNDLAKGLKDLDLGADIPPMQRSLRISWDIATDKFMFQVSTTEKPYNRRRVLSVVNSLFDPLGFAAPVSIKGRKSCSKSGVHGKSP
ncbi:RNA-binding protein Musashi [Sarotherodon galilaeus]